MSWQVSEQQYDSGIQVLKSFIAKLERSLAEVLHANIIFPLCFSPQGTTDNQSSFPISWSNPCVHG